MTGSSKFVPNDQARCPKWSSGADTGALDGQQSLGRSWRKNVRSPGADLFKQLAECSLALSDEVKREASLLALFLGGGGGGSGRGRERNGLSPWAALSLR